MVSLHSSSSVKMLLLNCGKPVLWLCRHEGWNLMVGSALLISSKAFPACLWDSCMFTTCDIFTSSSVFLKYKLLFRISSKEKLVALFSWFVVIYFQGRRKHWFLSCRSMESCYIAVAFTQSQLRLAIKSNDNKAYHVISLLHWLSWELQRTRATVVIKITSVSQTP